MLNLVTFKATNLTFFCDFHAEEKAQPQTEEWKCVEFLLSLNHYKCRWQLIDQTDIKTIL